jgi:hypothetical protein
MRGGNGGVLRTNGKSEANKMTQRHGKSAPGADASKQKPKQKQLGSMILGLVANGIVEFLLKRPDSEYRQRAEQHEETIRWTKRAFYGLVAYATLTFLLLIVATCQLQSSRDTEIRQLRAYIGITTATPLQMGPNVIVAMIDNFGQTPANQVKFFSNWEFMGPTERPGPTFGFPEKPECQPNVLNLSVILSAGPVFPKNPIAAQRLHCPDEIPQLQAAERREKSAFFYGHIEYRDAFGERRRTNFCYLYISGGSPLCDRYNEIDPKE